MAGIAKRIARLQEVGLSESGRPLYLPGEVEQQLFDSVDFELEDRKRSDSDGSTLKGGLLYLTTHRIIWVGCSEGGRATPSSVSPSFSSPSTSSSPFSGAVGNYGRSTFAGTSGSGSGSYGGRNRAFAIPLSSIKDINTFKRSIMGTPRVRIRLSVGADDNFIPSSFDRASDGHEADVVAVFRAKPGYDRFISKAAEVLRAKSWNDVPQSSSARPLAPISGGAVVPEAGPEQRSNQPAGTPITGYRRSDPSLAGVGGLLRKEENMLKETDRNLQEAFTDLNALMAKAKEMVAIAQMMRTKLRSGDTGDEPGSRQEMEDWLLSFGIVSPVTRETAGALYHQQLARQLADFVRVPLERAGGMLSLVDTYCMFNRARGTELISPQDLVQACQIWEKIDVSTRIRRFDSGVIVIQPKSHSDEKIFAQLLELVATPEGRKNGLSASEAARALKGLTPIVAKEELLAAEQKGLLCRDDSVDGLRFHYNFFKEVH